MIPHQHVALGPLVEVLVPRLELMGEQRLEHAIALRRVQLVDADGVARIAVQRGAPTDRMRQEHRMHGRRPPLPLLLRERRPEAAWPAAHVLPELVEVVRRRRAPEATLQLR